MSPGERAASGRREPGRPHYAATAPGFPPPYYPPYGVPPNAWLGAPLISMTGRSPPSRHAPVSKLAMHTQGAPLIIHNRQDRRTFVNTSEQRTQRLVNNSENSTRERCDSHDGNRPRHQQQSRLTRNGRNNNTDAVSVASDESSGSTNSETMLPRIIKPRKRRKKDRKPNNMVVHDMTSSLDLGDVNHCVVSTMGTGSRHLFDESYCRDNVSVPYRLDVKVLDLSEPVSETYRVSALGEALEATRYVVTEAVSPSKWASSSCQCRYCDPVGQIWDSESITDLLDGNSSDFPPTKLEDSMKVVGFLGRRGTDTALRRSWSDPSSRVPDRRDINYTDNASAPNLYSLFPPSRRASSPEPRSPLALEISSEIVTSMNGHRDLEIKLFSTSPPATNTDQRSFFVDKNESAVNKRAITAHDRKVNSAVKSDKYGLSLVKAESKNSEVVSESGCSSAFVAGESSHNVCDLALVTA